MPLSRKTLDEQAIAKSDDFISQFKSSVLHKKPYDNIIDFVRHKDFCNLRLYPRQETIMKLIYLETELMTDYDMEVIDGWTKSFGRDKESYGVQPDIWERIAWLKERGYDHFPHVQAVMGRRAGKGMLGGIIGAERIANLIALDDPQAHFGLNVEALYLSIIATSQTQAKNFLFADVRKTVTGNKWLSKFISTNKDHMLTFQTPADVRRIAKMRAQGIPLESEIASIRATPMSSSSAGGRGGSNFFLGFDEFAHGLQGTEGDRDSANIYASFTPALDQLGKDAMIYMPSSPWSKAGIFYDLYVSGKVLTKDYMDKSGLWTPQEIDEADRELDAEEGLEEVTADPEMLIIQLPSWEPYLDWEQGPKLVGTRFKRAIQVPPWGDNPENLKMARLKKRNPTKFKVEREAQFAEVIDAYLDADKVDAAFEPWNGRVLEQQTQGRLDFIYHGHSDPSRSNCFAGETEYLTIDGVKTLADTVGTTQMVLGRSGRWTPAEIKEGGVQPLRKITLRRQGIEKVVYATGNHRFPVVVKHSRKRNETIKTSDELMQGDKIPNQFARFFPCDPSPTGIQAGIVYGDGSTSHSGGSRVALWGEKDAALLKWFANHPTRPVASAMGVAGIEVNALPGFMKRFPDLNESRGYLLGWLMGYFAADGTVSNGSAIFTSRHRESLEMVLRICDQLGIPHYAIRTYNNPGYNGDQEMFTMAFEPSVVGEEFFLIDEHRKRIAGRIERSGKRNMPCWIVQSVEGTDRIEQTYCPSVPDGEQFTLADNVRVFNCNFAVSIGHLEQSDPDEFGHRWWHVVFDYTHVYAPSDYEDHIVDYVQIENDLEDLFSRFPALKEFTFDGWNSAGFIAQLTQWAADMNHGVRVHTEDFTNKRNQEVAEKFKSALNLGWVHIPRDNLFNNGEGCLAEQELKFLMERNGVVQKQSVGPVTTKDLADCIMAVTVRLLTNQLDHWQRTQFSALRPEFGLNEGWPESGAQRHQNVRRPLGDRKIDPERAARNRNALDSFKIGRGPVTRVRGR